VRRAPIASRRDGDRIRAAVASAPRVVDGDVAPSGVVSDAIGDAGSDESEVGGAFLGRALGYRVSGGRGWVLALSVVGTAAGVAVVGSGGAAV